jgi:hypothetical protein
MAKLSKILNPSDARSMRGILSRGPARYGVSRAPKPGNISSVQQAAQNRIKKMQKLNDARRGR